MENRQIQTSKSKFSTSLISALEGKDKFSVNLAIKPYKDQAGAPNFPALFSIPVENRLPAMAKENIQKTAAILAVSITSAVETMNLSRPMTASQIIDLVDTIIETSSEDNLALEDVVLFLQKLTRGQYGPLYESMDIPKFMEKFEQFRQDRHEAILNLRYDQSVQHKCLPFNDRLADMFPDDERKKHTEALINHMRETEKSNHP